MSTRKQPVDESKPYVYIDLIPNTSYYNPHDMYYTDQESCILDYRGKLVPPTLHRKSIAESQAVSTTTVEYDQ